MRVARHVPLDTRNYMKAVYAPVLVRMLDDLADGKPSSREYRLSALRWFTEEVAEVALVAAACDLGLWAVYAKAAEMIAAPNCSRPVQITSDFASSKRLAA